MRNRAAREPGSRVRIAIPPRFGEILATAACGVVAFVFAFASINAISLWPLKITPRQLDVAGAGARVILDNPRPLLGDSLANDGDYQTLQKRAALIGSLMASQPVRQYIARRAGVSAEELVGRSRVTANVQAALTEPDSEPRAATIGEANARYRVEIHPDPVLPTLNVFAQAPTVPAAERLADAVVPATREYLRDVAVRSDADPDRQVVLEQPGRSRGALINGGARIQIFVLTFALVFALAIVTLLLAARLRRASLGGSARKRGREAPIAHPSPPRSGPARRPGPIRMPALAGRLGPALSPAVALVPGGALAPGGSPVPGGTVAADGGSVRPPQHAPTALSPRAAPTAGDWPRTTRVLPWLLAAIMAIVWLVPFNLIELSYSLPIDVTLDRLLLPAIVATWILSLAAGGAGAPRVRITWIHVAVAAVALAALLSLVVNAHSLNQTLELDTAMKKLTLLASYISLFVVVASSIRRSEVTAFTRYTLALALMCALGTIWEYRFAYNVFYSVSDALLSGVFTVGTAEAGAVDATGRRVVRGPGEVPLEAVAMLAMGLPIALAGLIASPATRTRLLYGIATAVILAAAASTERKSALLAPASVLLTFAYFRRKELIRLAPLGVVVGGLMLMLTPGAAQSVVSQLSGKRFNSVTTVSDRSSDYDAVRPDVLSHLAFGRGYGSYEHTSYRILDMELLRQVVEVGVVGLLAFILLIGAIVGVARRPIRERRPDAAGLALAVASAAVVLLVVSTLFDAMAFPHVPYIALWMAGLLVVIVTHDRSGGGEGAWSS